MDGGGCLSRPSRRGVIEHCAYIIVLPLESIASSYIAQTCRPLRASLNQRSLWASFLRSLCKRDGLFQSSYSFATMSLEALQHATSHPSRWRQIIEAHHAKDTEKLPNLRELGAISSTKVQDIHSRPNIYHKLYLVPGGRFLLAAEERYIQLWDLGLIGEAHHTGSRLVSEHGLRVGHPIEIQDITACMMDERKLRVGIATFGQSELRSVPPHRLPIPLRLSAFLRPLTLEFESLISPQSSPILPLSRSLPSMSVWTSQNWRQQPSIGCGYILPAFIFTLGMPGFSGTLRLGNIH